MNSIDRQIRIRGSFNVVVKEYDRQKVPYIAYLYEGGYAARKLAIRGKDGNLISTTSKTKLARIEADIKRLNKWPYCRIVTVIRCLDGENKTENFC